MPDWTTSQINAIHAQGMSLLVSAGAGSGKTTVLTQRIIERIKAGDSVMDFLVVTFTNASAADLKEKLYNAISTLVAEHPRERRYRAQLYLLPSASISTIDSFCIGLVRANFQTLGLSPNVRTADEQEARMLAMDAMEETADAFYEEAGEGRAADFSLLADTFSDAKSDEDFLKAMLDLYAKLRAFDDPFGWLAEKGNGLLVDAALLEAGGDLYATAIGEHLRHLLATRLEALADEADELYTYVAGAEGAPENLKTAVFWQAQTRLFADAAGRNHAAFCEAARAYRAVKQPNINYGNLSAEDKTLYDKGRTQIKKQLDKLLEHFVAEPSECARQFALTGRVLLAMHAFLSAFDERYAERKREKGVMDFSDAPHFLLRLLEQDGQPTPLCLSLRKQIKEVYIDEYQDVSPLQDRLFSLLSSGNNRFMVGDVKQSIYRFRNAYPDIFLGYKDRFADYDDVKDDPSAQAARIFLRENFRCGEQVIRFVNLLFRTSTVGTVYEREYRGEELVFAKRTKVPQIPVTVAVAPYDQDKDEAAEREAAYIAEEILRLVKQETRETPEGPAPYRYQDITLLFRKVKGYTEVYERALRSRGIPYKVTTEEPFFDQPEILLAMAILKAIDDPTDDISLFAMLRSPVALFTAGEVYEIRRRMKEPGPLYRALQHAAEGTVDAALSRKCAAFLAELADFRAIAEGMSCHAFLWELYTRCGLLPLCNRRERKGLLLLYEYARKFETTGYKGLSGFLSYLKTAEEKGIELSGSGEGGDVDRVLLTSIHKSKGLEYAAVFLCDCDRGLFSTKGKSFTLLRNDGIFFKLKDFERLTVQNTLPGRYAALAEREAEHGEELRKLYVACTRARERLYLTGKCDRGELERGSFRPRSPRSFLDLALYAVNTEEEPDCRVFVEIGETGGEGEPALSVASPETQDAAFLTPEAEEAIRFVYPHGGSGLPAKVSVSALKEGALSESEASPAAVEYSASSLLCAPSFCGEEPQAAGSAAEAGTANHLFLQFCRWENVERNGVRAEIDRLRNSRMLDERQLALLDESGLEQFFRSSLYARMRASSALYREQRFSVRAPASIIGGEEGEEVLLQGVIDCFFAEPDGSMTIVDYKTDRVKDGAALRRKHAVQLACYRLAVEKMTGKPVKETLLWSFYLNKEV